MSKGSKNGRLTTDGKLMQNGGSWSIWWKYQDWKPHCQEAKVTEWTVEQIIWEPEEEKPEKSQQSMDVVGRVKQSWHPEGMKKGYRLKTIFL